MGYPGRRGTENELRTAGEQRLGENMSADGEEVNEWKLQAKNETRFLHMCDLMNIAFHMFPAAAAMAVWFLGVTQPVRLY